MIKEAQLTSEVIGPMAVPATAAKSLWYVSGRHTNDPWCTPPDFNLLLKVSAEDGTTTYAAQHERRCEPYFGLESTTHLIDLGSNEQPTGRCQIRVPLEPHMLYKTGVPFVGWTNTEPKFSRQGLATRRLIVMNFVSKLLYDATLHSSASFLSPYSEHPWKWLVKLGEAEQYAEPSGTARVAVTRYRFTR